MNGNWSPEGWRKFPAQQQPDYSGFSKEVVDDNLAKLKMLPPLVHASEIDCLKKQIAEAQEGKRFLLQGGDCAEIFAECEQESIEARLKILLQMSLVLTWGGRMPTIKVGRLAGQYSKPRSKPTEKIDDGAGGKMEIGTYKGDLINRIEATKEARLHDPTRLVQAHFHAGCTLNYVRALIKGGFADLHRSSSWDLGGFKDLARQNRYQEITDRIVTAINFMEACGMPEPMEMSAIDFFTSHEGLVLEYESAVTRKVLNHVDNKLHSTGSAGSTRDMKLRHPEHSHPESHYNLGTHFLWIGNRTRQLDGAHVEYFRGVANPIGIKVGAEMANDPSELISLISRINPTNEPGKITLITRLGKDKVTKCLPTLIFAVRNAGARVLWSSDPMHGNTYTADGGIKTRQFDDILAELTTTFRVHEQNGSILGGVHFELTGENVTECVGGPQNLSEKELHLRYTSYCDPRLNYIQSMEMSFLLAKLLQDRRSKSKL